ncbi:[acyl-carrier-protein] S-malonyltransferase [Pseudoxanthomonas sp. GM95]|uniref:malonate decarboxylase subunit epsilon n=1 Tax=Pseudoxanthomonas sp. GM95 TaxID=1881043 RepID=UPI0008AF2E5A|nr:malonate decarboxylase subunit epsilon [Pseudoxanthomonas sp. GM95]SEL46792.1 [acyl-carrier-protein] S-malonyltransferase [Pseudoxanthomonas sp. GM95]
MSLALLCPGQGGQHPAMFDRVLDNAEVAPLLQQAEAVLGAAPQDLAANDARFDNRRAQPLVCAGTLAHWLALREQLPAPTLVLGYSVGELAAHAVAGSISTDACLALAATRASVMDAASPADSGLMAVTGLVRSDIDCLCEQFETCVAIANGEDHVVLGGRRRALMQLAEAATAQGARCTLLPVSVPAHTPALQAATDNFVQALRAASVRAPGITVLAGVDGSPVRTAEGVIDTLAAQISRSVEWSAVMEQAVERGARVFLELGPGSALSRMLREAYPECEARSVEEFRSLEGAAAWVAAAQERLQ